MSGIDLSTARLVPVAGVEGWLARLPGAVVWVLGPAKQAGELLSTCLAAPGPSELLGRVGSRLADSQAAPWPPFVIVAVRGPDLVSVVHGPVELGAVQEGSETSLYGGDEVGSWLNRALKGVTLLRSGEPGDVEDLSDLRDGVVRASGFVLTGGPETKDAEHAPSGGGRRTSRQPGGAGGPGRGEGSEKVEPSPQPERTSQAAGQAPSANDKAVAEAPTVVEGRATSFGVTVRGVNCPQGHINDPRDSACRICGARIDPGAPEVVGPRPPLGRLTWDNGEVHELAGPTLVGRDVNLDGAVIAGELSPLVPGGQIDSMSRVHAELRFDGWDLLVVDRGSTNGTFVWDEKTKAWQRLVPGEPQVVLGGTVLAFGERTATFETAPIGVP
jgi:hypothetical protein